MVMKSSIFWNITTCRIWGSHTNGYEEFYLLGWNQREIKLQAKSSSETSVDLQQITLRYIPENSTLQDILCWSYDCLNISIVIFHI
jgi:hypothetical protein